LVETPSAFLLVCADKVWTRSLEHIAFLGRTDQVLCVVWQQKAFVLRTLRGLAHSLHIAFMRAVAFLQ